MALCVGDGERVVEDATVRDAVADPLGVRVGLGDSVEEPVDERLGLPEALLVAVALGVRATLVVCVCVAVAVPDEV